MPEKLTAQELYDFGDIPVDVWERLLNAARTAHDNSYSPYSDFPVGAALLTDDGEIITGCNVEFATLGATVCAERTAVGNAVTEGHRTFEAIAIVTNSDEPAAPCGICRQVLAEFCLELPILLANRDHARTFTTLDEILPMAFRGDELDD